MTYLIKMPHTQEECLRALDEQLAKGSDVLSKVFFGCKVGDHTGYAIVDAVSENEARKLIPQFLLGKSIITEVGKFTPDMIRSFHKKAA
jgi:hypothetical protein